MSFSSIGFWKDYDIWRRKEKEKWEFKLAPSNFCAAESMDVRVLIIADICVKDNSLRRKGWKMSSQRYPPESSVAGGHGGKRSGAHFRKGCVICGCLQSW